MASDKKIIDSLYLQNELNPKIWYFPKEKYMGDSEGQEEKLKSEIRDRLLKIANIFIDYLDVDLYVEDVVLIGSLTGYNWSFTT
jgi:hypothetical protein